jgi:ATP-dependent HslUV protease ATP-binding subunit HslU
VQHKSLLKTEAIDLEFTDEAIREIAKYTYDINKTHENIGMNLIL